MIKPYQLQIMFILLFVCTIFVNKYVLTILKFTYPTIFQGWQTLVGAVVLKILYSLKAIKLNISLKNRSELLQYLPCMLFFVCSIYSGSKALSQLPIPIFIALQSISSLISMIGEVAIHRRLVFGVKYFVVMFALISSVMVARTNIIFNPSAYRWMTAHILSSGVLNLLASILESKLTSTEKLYSNYVFSFVVLTPSSIFLGDALAAKHYEYIYFYKFYVGCVLSGVYGVFLNLCLSRLRESDHSDHLWTYEEFMETVAKILASVVSLFVFDDVFTSTGIMWFFVNSCLCVLLSYIHWSQTREQHDNVQPVNTANLTDVT